MFDKRKEQHSGIESAAKGLDEIARKNELSIEASAPLTQEQIETINPLFYFTKAANVIHHLRILSLSDPAKHERAMDILKHFERLTYFSLPLSARMRVFTYVNQFTPLNGAIEDFFTDKTLSKPEISKQLLSWSSKWLGLVYEDGVHLKQIALLFGPALSIRVHQVNQEVSRQVNLVVGR